MTFFRDKIRAGIESARQALDNNREIDEVFVNLQNELIAMGIPGRLAFEDLNSFQLTNIPVGAPSYLRQKLVLEGPEATFSLGYFARSENGYPCALVIGKSVTTANDRVSLENVLGELFATSRVGRMLHSLSPGAFNANPASAQIGLGGEDRQSVAGQAGQEPTGNGFSEN